MRAPACHEGDSNEGTINALVVARKAYLIKNACSTQKPLQGHDEEVKGN